MRRYSRITGTGSYLPPRRLTNADLVAELGQRGIETSDEWIVERTGIRARHFAAPDVTSSDLGLEAARNALQAAGLQPTDIDLIIVATSTPDMVFPSTACILQNKLGANGCAAFDVQAVCSGFVYALTVADSMIRSGAAQRALVVGAEVLVGGVVAALLSCAARTFLGPRAVGAAGAGGDEARAVDADAHQRKPSVWSGLTRWSSSARGSG